MPDRATMEAARPKCTAIGLLRATNGEGYCGRPMRYDAKAARWICPDHGTQATPASLVARQLAAPAESHTKKAA